MIDGKMIDGKMIDGKMIEAEQVSRTGRKIFVKGNIEKEKRTDLLNGNWAGFGRIFGMEIGDNVGSVCKFIGG